MKKQSPNSKSFWQDDIVLKTTKHRQWIEYLVKKRKIEHSKFSSRIIRFLKKIF